MALTNENKSSVITDYQTSGTDTGSPEVQVALLSARIEDLSGHFKTHKHDNHSRQGLQMMVNWLRKMLDYLKANNVERYRTLIARLGLRK